MKNYVVIGLGLFGRETAVKLYQQGKTVLAIDKNISKVEDIADHVTRAVSADATKRDVLLQLGVHKCDCAIVAMTRDLSASVLTTMNLKALGVKEIICKAQSSTDQEILETLGATRTIIPEMLAADKLCQKLTSNNVLEYIALSDTHSIIEIQAPREWQGKSLKEINVRARYDVTIIAIKDASSIMVSPSADYLITSGSVLVILGDQRSLGKVQKL